MKKGNPRGIILSLRAGHLSPPLNEETLFRKQSTMSPRLQGPLPFSRHSTRQPEGACTSCVRVLG